MRGNRAPEILKPDSKAREMEFVRSEQAKKQLADVGIALGGYRLEPALGGKILDFRQRGMRVEGRVQLKTSS